MQLFLSGLGQIVFYAVYLSISLFVPMTVVLIRRRHALPVKAKFAGGSKASSQPLFGIIFLIILPALLFGYAGIGILPDWTYYLGLSLSLLGFTIWFLGQQALGQYFSSEVVIYQGHQLVERGPYRFVRHPMYTGFILLSVGMELAVQSWPGAVFIAIVLAIGIRYRIPVEEQALISEFGEQYISYSIRVKRKLIPFIF